LRRIFRKWVLQALFLLSISYVLIYVLLSAGGEMLEVEAKAQWVWTPYGLRFDTLRNKKNETVVRGSFFGYVFAPLIIVDRLTLHPSVTSDSPQGLTLKQRRNEIEQHEWQRHR